MTAFVFGTCSPTDICEQWERNSSLGSADVCGEGMRDEAQRTSAGKACAHEFLIFYDVIYGLLQQFCRVLAFYLAIIPRVRVAYEWKNCFIKKKKQSRNIASSHRFRFAKTSRRQ